MAYDPISQTEEDIRKAKGSFSSSAFVPNLKPSDQDLQTESRLSSLKSKLSLLQSQKAAEDWYGNSKDEEAKAPKQSMIERGIDALNVPTYAIVGGVKSLVGQSDKGLVGSMNANMQNKELFGDVLTEAGVPRYIAGPVGFALDVGAGGLVDLPSIALSGGFRATTALGKLAFGAEKAQLKGLGLAAKSVALEKASGLARFAPIGKVAKEAVYGASTKALTELEEAAGETFMQSLGRPNLWKAYGPELLPSVEKAVKAGAEKIGVGKQAEAAWEFAVAQPLKWYEKSLQRDILRSAGAIDPSGAAMPGAVEAFEKYGMEKGYLSEAQRVEKWGTPGFGTKDPELFKKMARGDSGSLTKISSEIPSSKEIIHATEKFPTAVKGEGAVVEKFAKQQKGIQNAAPDFYLPEDSKALLEQFLDEADDELAFGEVIKTLKNFNVETNTGFKMWDNLVSFAGKQKLGDVPVLGKLVGDASFKRKAIVAGQAGEMGKVVKKEVKFKDVAYMKEMLDMYSKYITMFTTAKVGLSTTSRFGSWLGNPVMAHMEGWNVLDPNFSKRTSWAERFYKGKISAKEAEEVLKTPEMMDFARDFSGTFSRTFGFKHGNLGKASLAEDVIMGAPVKSLEKIVSATGDQQAKAIGDALDAQIKGGNQKAWKELVDWAMGMKKNSPGDLEGGFVDFVRKWHEANPGGTLMREDLPINLSSNLVDNPAVVEWKRIAAIEAVEGGAVAKAKNWLLTKPMANFETADHSFRLGHMLRLTKDGVTGTELEKARRFYKIAAEDIAEVVDRQGQRYYKLTPMRATEIAQGTFMNYAAMPAAIKALRQIPVLGSPFAAFGYSMFGKTAQTAVLNPSAFTKAENFLHEASLTLAGQQTPMEKQALAGNQAYLNSPWMLRMQPFFTDNPVYISMKNATPFLTNLLSSNERTWSDTLGGQVGHMLDSTPLMKDPIGSLIMSYFFLPLFLDEGETPQSMFGTQLYPKNATTKQKAGIIARDAAESVMPAAAGLAAWPLKLAAPEIFTDPNVIDKLPSYGLRGALYANLGKSSVGVGSKTSIDNPAEKAFMKTVSSALGAPISTVYKTLSKPKE